MVRLIYNKLGGIVMKKKFTIEVETEEETFAVEEFEDEVQF